jgi:hypothetical protein
MATDMKRRNSLVESRACPSAIFDGMETDARRIWAVKPKISAFGNETEAE